MMYSLNKNDSAGKIPCIYDIPCDPKDRDYEKLFCPNNELSEPSRTRSDRLKTGSSCQALKHAVAALHRIDDFHKEKIGEGFFSDVYKVTHQTTGQVMVLKMNLRHSNRFNMLKEIQLMNRLAHPNVLRLMGVCVHEGQLHALTEYIDGGSLHQIIHDAQEVIEQHVRVSIAKDVASGMEYLHAKGVIHRDLTSKNVLVKRTGKGRFKALVGDLGLSTNIPDPKAKTKLPIVGSPYWMSPEGLNGKHYDERSDIFSYGIVLCELIARVEADPDYLPRTDNFGLDYLAFTELCGPNVVPEFLTLAFRCCSIDPKSRPTFTENVRTLGDILDDMMNNTKTNNSNTSSSTMMGRRDHNNVRLTNYGCTARSEEQLPRLLMGQQSTSCGGGCSSVVAVARSEEQLPQLMSSSSASSAPQHRKIVKRRSLSEDFSMLQLSALATPSDKARRHALLMCRQDPHYKPRTTNPFAHLAHFQGVKKLLGNFSSCCEIPSLTATDSNESPKSLPGSPTAARKTTTPGVGTATATTGANTNSTFRAPLFVHPLYKGGSSSNLLDFAHEAPIVAGLRRRGSCESGFYSNVGECLSPNSLWGDSGTPVSSLRSLDELEPAELHALCKRASSICTDSSEDISSLTSTDWPVDLHPNISTIVDYFERKGATLRHPGGVRGGQQLSSRIAALRRSLEKHNNQGAGGSGIGGNSASSGSGSLLTTTTTQRPKCSRLVVCEGAVRSKLPLFDKK